MYHTRIGKFKMFVFGTCLHESFLRLFFFFVNGCVTRCKSNSKIFQLR